MRVLRSKSSRRTAKLRLSCRVNLPQAFTGHDKTACSCYRVCTGAEAHRPAHLGISPGPRLGGSLAPPSNVPVGSRPAVLYALQTVRDGESRH